MFVDSTGDAVFGKQAADEVEVRLAVLDGVAAQVAARATRAIEPAWRKVRGDVANTATLRGGVVAGEDALDHFGFGEAGDFRRGSQPEDLSAITCQLLAAA